MTTTTEGVNHHNWPIKVLLLNVFYVLSVVCIGPIKILTALTIGNGKLHNLLSKGNYLWFYEAVLQGVSGTIHEPKHYPES